MKIFTILGFITVFAFTFFTPVYSSIIRSRASTHLLRQCISEAGPLPRISPGEVEMAGALRQRQRK